MKCSALTALVAVALLVPACTSSQTRPEPTVSALEHTRTFFGQLTYTSETYEVDSGMRDLEELLTDRFPEDMLEEDGTVPSEYLAGLYSQAARGDRFITYEEFTSFREIFMREVEKTLPDPVRAIRPTSRR